MKTSELYEWLQWTVIAALFANLWISDKRFDIIKKRVDLLEQEQ